METRRGLRLVGALDFKPAIAGQMTLARIIVADRRHRLDRTATIDRRLDVDALVETPVAFDDRVGSIDAVDDDRDAGAAGNRNHRPVAFGAGGTRRSNHDCQYD